MQTVKRTVSVQKLTAAALLIAIGVVIPMVMPLKVVIEPASFTLASHVAVFLAMFISPGVAGAVAVGTTLGFLLGGFAPVIVLRAATHLVFALIGSFYLKKHPGTLSSPAKATVFSLLIGLIHGAAEVAVVSAFYFGGGMGGAYYEQGFVTSVMLLVGVGSVIHSMVDFAIAMIVYLPLSKQKALKDLFQTIV